MLDIQVDNVLDIADKNKEMNKMNKNVKKKLQKIAKMNKNEK